MNTVTKTSKLDYSKKLNTIVANVVPLQYKVKLTRSVNWNMHRIWVYSILPL